MSHSPEDLRYAEKLKARAAGTVPTETHPSVPAPVAGAPVDEVTARYNAKLAARSAKKPAEAAAAAEEAKPEPKADDKPTERGGRR